jgi:hypothetical protein
MMHQLKGRASPATEATLKDVPATIAMTRGRAEAGFAPTGVMRIQSEARMEGTATTTGVAPLRVPEPERELPLIVSSEAVSEKTREEFARTLAYDILFYTSYSENNPRKTMVGRMEWEEAEEAKNRTLL